MGKSKRPDSLGRSAGARLTVILRAGKSNCAFCSAARTRSRLSLTSVSGSPTRLNAGNPPARWTSTSTGGASNPDNARLCRTARAMHCFRAARRRYTRPRRRSLRRGLCAGLARARDAPRAHRASRGLARAAQPGCRTPRGSPDRAVRARCVSRTRTFFSASRTGLDAIAAATRALMSSRILSPIICALLSRMHATSLAKARRRAALRKAD